MKSSEKSHKASMNNFDKEYNRTEKEVYKKTQKREKIASKTALSAVIPAVLLILFISAFLVEPINKAVKKSKIDSSKVKISEQIYSYLDNGDYVGLSKYSDSIDALDNNSFSEEYPVLMAARYYSWSQSFMNKQDNNYNLEEKDISGLSEYLSKFYYYSQISAYNDKNSTISDKNKSYLDKMRKDMGNLLKQYYHVIDDDLDKIAEYSQASISRCLIERSLHEN